MGWTRWVLMQQMQEAGARMDTDEGRRSHHEVNDHLDDREEAGTYRPWTAFWEQVLLARLVVSSVVAGVISALPVLGPQRLVLAASIAVSGIALNLVLLRRLRRGLSVRAAIAVGDVAMVVLAVALVPTTYAPATVLLVSMTATFVYWFGLRRSLRLIVPSGVALLAVGLVHQPPMWLPTWVAWLVTATFGVATIGRMAAVGDEERRRHDDMVNGIDALVWEGSGPVGDADYVSGRVTALLGYGAREFSRFSFLASLTHPDDLDALIESRRRVAAGQDVELQYRIRDARANQRHLHERITVSVDSDGRVRHRRGIMVDETARWDAEGSVRRYGDFIEGIPIALAILRVEDLDDPRSLTVVVGNPAAAALVGSTPRETDGRRLVELMPSITRTMLDRLADVARLGTPLERPYLEFDDDDTVYALRAMPLPDDCVGIALEDVTERARLADSLRHQALHDHLTGLPNRARLNERLEQTLAEGSDAGRVGLLLMDLNRFKEVNDSLGHAVGDRLLVELARRMSRGLRNCDTIARLGGDEFAVLVTELDGPGDAMTVAERLVELCVEPFEVDGYRLQIGASVGIAIHPDHARDPAVLLRTADAAMYRAKETGGGIVEHGRTPTAERRSRIDLLSELERAVDSDALVVHYQPRIELATLRPLGVEALVRWRHPDLGLLPPASFIELAEVSGTIQMLTRTVTERAARDMRRLSPDSRFAVNVNLSSRNLRDPQLFSWVEDVLERSGLPPRCLCFELTETQLHDDPATTVEVLHSLRRLGVRLSIDDFGTGQSSVSYLHDLPVDEVKIDCRFVAHLDAGDPTVVRSAIDLGHNLGLHVVAEGVETAVALDRLREMGCDSAQGYHLALPMPIGDLARYLDAEQPADHDH